jgi:hypothetical protein
MTTTWDELATAMNGRLDARGHMHLVIGGEDFFLFRVAWGQGTAVLAHLVVASEAHLTAREAALLSSDWPVGALVLRDGAWVLRHSFVGIPDAARARDALTGLGVQARALRRRSPVRVDISAVAHYCE